MVRGSDFTILTAFPFSLFHTSHFIVKNFLNKEILFLESQEFLRIANHPDRIETATIETQLSKICLRGYVPISFELWLLG
jgi:hypothetical protein